MSVSNPFLIKSSHLGRAVGENDGRYVGLELGENVVGLNEGRRVGRRVVGNLVGPLVIGLEHVDGNGEAPGKKVQLIGLL
jgi:hypothetical protein